MIIFCVNIYVFIGGGTGGAGGAAAPHFQKRGALPPQNPSLMTSQVSQIYLYSWQIHQDIVKSCLE